MTTLNYRTAFPDFGDLDVEIPKGFEDRSWNNDVCPSWQHPIANLRIWVDFKDRAIREFPDNARFTLESFNEETGVSGETIHTDDWSEIVAEVERRIKA
jgi:hypothetical protein